MPERPRGDLRRDEDVELETQFILRLPEEPAKSLREAILEGSINLRDRLTIKLEVDTRYGEVRFDDWLLYAKLVDLPSIIESLKTIDNKSFYKTADIGQMLICKYEPEPPQLEEESPNKNKKKDPNKVDKKYLWPHGITPPCKNVRKRRFRKTLKKKYVEAPEIEKEVKRLLRIDNDAVYVKHEIINEEEDIKSEKHKDDKGSGSKSNMKARDLNSDRLGSSHVNDSRDVGEQEIFGDVSSSDDNDDTNINVLEMDENSRLSVDDSRMSDSNFNFQDFKLFSPRSRKSSNPTPQDNPSTPVSRGARYYFGDSHQSSDNEDDFNIGSVSSRLTEVREQLNDLKLQRTQKELEISGIENQALRTRLQENLDNLIHQINDKEAEIQELQKHV